MREWKRRLLCGKHFCNDCEDAFIRPAERDFIYCLAAIIAEIRNQGGTGTGTATPANGAAQG